MRTKAGTVAAALCMTFVASRRIRSVGCVYAGRCAYAPDAAFTHMCLYAAVGAYTQRVRFRTWVRIRRWVRLREPWVRIRSGCVYAPPRVYTGFCVCTPDRVNAGIDEP